MKRVLFAFALAAALTARAVADDKKLDAPPHGISPTTATLSQILKHYAEATGRLEPGTPDTRQETWAFHKAGLAGTETLARSGADYRSRITAGPLVDEYGQFFGHGWHRDKNGVVTPVQSPDFESFEMLLFMRDFDEAGDPKNDVTVLGEVAQPKPAYVLEIKTTGAKHPDFAFYDKASGLIDRFDSVVDDTRVSLTYDDYRATDGLTQPWHIHFTDGTPALDSDFIRRSVTIGAPISLSEFAIPKSTIDFASYSGHQSLPAKSYTDSWYMRVSGGYHPVDAPMFIVRLNVGGRGLDFAVSAAQPQSLIDFDVAQQLGLPSYGQVTHAGGDNVPYDTIIPAATVGTGFQLHDWAVRATPFNYHASDETKVVGLIGYDVLSSGVFKIDFVNGKFDVFPSSVFDGDGPPEVKGATVLAVAFDDGYPFFGGSIAGHATSNILLDNDFETSMVFGNFTTAYPDAISDFATEKEHASTVVPFADAKAYGKKVDVWLGKVADLQLGPRATPTWRLSLPMRTRTSPDTSSTR